ncbi:MAG: hypothetical protein M3Y33_11075 [Actinomycetota bacterium]|nr:hypothetical protein [Actinomycetota bacterium]
MIAAFLARIRSASDRLKSAVIEYGIRQAQLLALEQAALVIRARSPVPCPGSTGREHCRNCARAAQGEADAQAVLETAGHYVLAGQAKALASTGEGS